MIACGHMYIDSESRIKLPKTRIKPSKTCWKISEKLLEKLMKYSWKAPGIFFSNICWNPV